jgi:hypothetical protein
MISVIILRLDRMKKHQDQTEIPGSYSKIKRQFQAGDRVQVHNFGEMESGNLETYEGKMVCYITKSNWTMTRFGEGILTTFGHVDLSGRNDTSTTYEFTKPYDFSYYSAMFMFMFWSSVNT